MAVLKIMYMQPHWCCIALCRMNGDGVRLPGEQVRLTDGVMMPTLGFGTAGLGANTKEAVGAALAAGYRLIDSAQVRQPCWQESFVEAMSHCLQKLGRAITLPAV